MSMNMVIVSRSLCEKNVIAVRKDLSKEGYLIEVEGKKNKKWKAGTKTEAKRKLKELKCKEIETIFNDIDNPRDIE